MRLILLFKPLPKVSSKQAKIIIATSTVNSSWLYLFVMFCPFLVVFLLCHVFLTSPRCDRGICSQSITTITSLKKLRLTTRHAVQWQFLSARIWCTFNPRRCKKPFENHKKFRTSKSQINCTVNAWTKSGKFVCLGICSYLLPKIFCRVFHLFIKFFDLQH